MAIASFVLHTGGSLESLSREVQAFPAVADMREVPPDKLAVTIDIPSARLSRLLKDLKNLRDVWNLELVYVNYEDDMDASGFINYPPDLEDE